VGGQGWWSADLGGRSADLARGRATLRSTAFALQRLDLVSPWRLTVTVVGARGNCLRRKVGNLGQGQATHVSAFDRFHGSSLGLMMSLIRDLVVFWPLDTLDALSCGWI